MADKNSGSVIQIIHETAYALAKKEMNLKEDDKQNQVKLTTLQIRIGQNEEEISENEDVKNEEELQPTTVTVDYAEAFQSIQGCAVILN